MLQSLYNKSKIRYLPESYLSLIYSDRKSSYGNFFVTDGTFLFHHKNVIHFFAVEQKSVYI